MTKRDIYKLQDPAPYLRALKMYEKRDINGLFAWLAGKYRWVYSSDFRQKKET